MQNKLKVGDVFPFVTVLPNKFCENKVNISGVLLNGGLHNNVICTVHCFFNEEYNTNVTLLLDNEINVIGQLRIKSLK